VSIVDSGRWNGSPFFVMERLQGQDLRSLLELHTPLASTTTVRVGLDICAALQVAHAAGVIHRDLKPENLFITRDEDGNDCCKVLDFGIAKLAEENLTLPGTLLGTARYMAPEQITHDSPVGPATDFFSLGVVLFECLTGQVPFPGDSLESVLYKIVNDEAAALRELRPELPQSLADLIARALNKDPAQRPQTAAEFASLLAQPGLDMTLSSRAVTQGAFFQGPATAKTRGRHWLQLSGAAFGVGMTCGLAIGYAGRSLLPFFSLQPVAPAAAASQQPRAAGPAAPRAPEPSAVPQPSTPSEPVASVREEATPRVHAVESKSSYPSSSSRPAQPPLFFPAGDATKPRSK
jgi:hypothetical protein